MGLILCSNSAARLEEGPAHCFATIAGCIAKGYLLDTSSRETTKSNDLQSKELKHHAFIYNMYNNYIQIDIVIHFDFNVGTVNYMAKLSI